MYMEMLREGTSAFMLKVSHIITREVWYIVNCSVPRSEGSGGSL